MYLHACTHKNTHTHTHTHTHFIYQNQIVTSDRHTFVSQNNSILMSAAIQPVSQGALIYVCACVCVCMYIYIRVCIYIYIYIYICMCVRHDKCMHACMFVCIRDAYNICITYEGMCVCAYKHIRHNKCMHACMYVYIRDRRNVNKCICKNI
jgi:hypothetical protein